MDMSQEKISELVGISTEYRQKIEKGKHSPTWLIWLKICMLLNLDVAEIEKEICQDL